jgi:DegV family protein with EDD domain
VTAAAGAGPSDDPTAPAGDGARRRVRIITDSSASLPADLVERHQIGVVPLGLSLGDEFVHDGEIDLAEIVHRGEVQVTTSAPSPGDFVRAIGDDPGESVVIVTVAQSMSSTFTAARLAAKAAKPQVRVVDSGTAAGAQGLVVLAAAAAAERDCSLDDVETAVQRASGVVRLVAAVDGLEHLRRSGRVPGVVAAAGRLVSLQPLFAFEQGRVRRLAPATCRSAAGERILRAWRRTRRGGGALHVAALHALAPERAVELLEAVCDEVEPATAFVGEFSPAMVVHAGPGLVGLAWWWETG